MGENQYIEKLSNAPLKEVVFEVQWELNTDETSNNKFDSYFDLALGVFYGFIKSDFDKLDRIVPPFLPKESLNYVPQFRFSNNQNQYPLIQFGEGVLTINDNCENYHWNESFYPLIVKILERLIESYEGEISFNKVSLHYINSVDVDLDSNENQDYLDFLSTKLNYKVSRDFKLDSSLNGFNFQEYIQLENTNKLEITIGTGVNTSNKKKQLIWQNIISKEASQTKESLLDWLVDAHDTTSSLFRNMLNSELYGSFKS